MRKIDELRGPSCLTAAADDEPIFVLKSTDELAPDIVIKWALAYRMQKIEAHGEMTDKQIAKYEEALTIAGDMRRWREEHT
jgi:hypothetical protein